MTFTSLSRKLYLWYLRNKDLPYFSLGLYGVVLLVSIVLLFSVIIPQVKDWVSVQKEVSATRTRITTMNDNIAYLLALNESQLEDDLAVVTTALPPERDVASLIVAINVAAANAGLVLDDFSFQVGETTSRSPSKKDVSQNGTGKITFSVQGALPQTTKLLIELHRKIPLLAIDSINAQFLGSSRTQITVLYYYKALPLLNDQNDKKLMDLTPQQQILLDQLRSWQVSQIEFATPEGSASGQRSPF